ncbi:MAG: shikimate dehydrogenase, partial [Kiritimatiellae bacterium]|nr:shikimate dehydrogenase [Kiritimatiellia bacterium]
CTPVGLREDDPAVLPPEAFRCGQLVYDLVYTRRATPTMCAALSGGAEAVNGMGMLVYQGAAAFTIWTGLCADSAAMRLALEEHIYKSAN